MHIYQAKYVKILNLDFILLVQKKRILEDLRKIYNENMEVINKYEGLKNKIFEYLKL
jgi:hypothetical protein